MTDKKLDLKCGPLCSITSLSTAPSQCISFCLAERCPELIQQLLTVAAKYPTGSFFVSQRPDVPLELRQMTVFSAEQVGSSQVEIWKLVLSLGGGPFFQFFKSGQKVVERELKDISNLLSVSNEICKSVESIPKTKVVNVTFRLYLEAPSDFKGPVANGGEVLFKHVSVGTILTLRDVRIVAISGKNIIIERSFTLSKDF